MLVENFSLNSREAYKRPDPIERLLSSIAEKEGLRPVSFGRLTFPLIPSTRRRPLTMRRVEAVLVFQLSGQNGKFPCRTGIAECSKRG